MMFIIYDFIFVISGLFFLPYYILKKKSLRDILIRFKVIVSGINQFKRPIWIHAVSVGEVMAIRPLVKALKEHFSDKEIVISTVTSTGRKVAEEINQKTEVFYLPLDLSFLIRPLVKKIKPSLFILAETELWPNLILALKENNIPIVLVNGRISKRSFQGYRLISWLLSPVLKRIDMFLMQTAQDEERLLKLGLDKDKIKIVGNLKFDVVPHLSFNKDISFFRQQLGLKSNERFLVAGSTHPKEEEFVLEAYRRLKIRFPYLRLLIAPRHPVRSLRIKQIIKDFGFKGLLISSLDNEKDKEDAVFILDLMGRLLDFYYLADIVFVGGSIVKKGGHNILEPALFKKPIIFGPYMFNFGEISEQFLREDAAVLVLTIKDFCEAVEEILENPSRGVELGENAYNLIQKNRGSSIRHIKWISSIFNGT